MKRRRSSARNIAASCCDCSGPCSTSYAADLNELSEPGDGVISLRRGKLDGAQDVEVLRFSHVDAFSDASNPRIQAHHKAIASGLD